MYCRKCGENNPEEAIYCKNCGTKLKEEVKKPEVIETIPITNQNSQQNTSQRTTTTSTSNNNSSDWIGCCLCLIAIFIIFAIMGSF